MNPLGKSLILVGLGLAAVGVIILAAGKIPWLGHLPGDIVIRRGNSTFYFPLASSLIASAILSLLFAFLKRR